MPVAEVNAESSLPDVVASKVNAFKSGLPPEFTSSTTVPVESSAMADGLVPADAVVLSGATEYVLPELDTANPETLPVVLLLTVELATYT